MTHPWPCLSGLRRHIALALLLSLLGMAGPAWAAGCSVSSAGLAFGLYQPLSFPGKLTSADSISNAGISVVCTGIVGGGLYTLALGPSIAGPGDRVSTRYLVNSNGGDDMRFNVYTDAAYSVVWGDGAMGSLISGGIASGDSNRSITVYGRVPAGQNTLKAGSFAGSLTITLTYNP
jgi:spore coat protein U-like protein